MTTYHRGCHAPLARGWTLHAADWARVIYQAAAAIVMQVLTRGDLQCVCVAWWTEPGNSHKRHIRTCSKVCETVRKEGECESDLVGARAEKAPQSRPPRHRPELKHLDPDHLFFLFLVFLSSTQYTTSHSPWPTRESLPCVTSIYAHSTTTNATTRNWAKCRPTLCRALRCSSPKRATSFSGRSSCRALRTLSTPCVTLRSLLQ